MTNKKPPSPLRRQFHPGALADLASDAAVRHGKELDRATETLLIAHFGSLDQAIAHSGEYDLVFEQSDIEMLWTANHANNADNTVELRVTNIVRLERKEKP